jgi:uncharacterized protein YcbK (DUF882 family)
MCDGAPHHAARASILDSRWSFPVRRFYTILVLVAAAMILAAPFVVRGPAAQPASESVSAAPAIVVAPAAPSLEPVLGASGELRALIDLPATLQADAALTPLLAGRAIAAPGVHSLGAAAADGESLVVVSMAAFANPGAAVAGYHVGAWPAGQGTRGVDYTPPAGYVSVTPENERTQVSKHFQLGDFVTHDQSNVWPKVLVLRPRLLDKLELISAALEARGLPSKLHVMSGFRTPQYNALEVHPGGRAEHSRHMYGDAADVFVDADGDGQMDDLDGDGRITMADARVLESVAEGVEAAHPELVGGLGIYHATAAHGPFVHVDTRGVKARW